MPTKVRELISMLTADGWVLDRQKGSHRQFKHPSKPGVVTVPGKPGDDIAPGTLASMFKQAGFKK
jgi:predicted RNA binding protein YcfA (HicA-like mRNA interferase family)